MTEVKGFFYPRTAGGQSSLIPSPPWYYSGDLLTVEYRTDPARVAELLPAPLELAAEDPGAVALIWADWQSCSSSREELLDPVRAQYKEAFVVVRCSFEGQTYSRCVYIWVDKDFAMGRGIHQGYPKKLGSMWQTRPHPFAQGAPQVGAGGVFGATLAAGDRRLAEAVLTLREETETNGFVNSHKMAHHRIFPGIEAGAPDAYAELIESGASEFEARAGLDRRRRATAVRLPDRRTVPAHRRRDHRRLLPPGGRRLERWPVAGDADPGSRGCRGDPMSSNSGADFADVEDVSVDTRHWIGGQRVASASTFDDVSPIDEQVIAKVHAGGQQEVDAAVAAAQAAFPAWAALDRRDRADLLRAVADGVDKRVEDLSRVETRDNGSLLRSHRRGVMPRVAMNFRYFADYLDKLDHPDEEIRGHRERFTYHPAGVTAIITPWNAPLMLATWRIGPALAAGNTVVLKPPEWAPLTASLLADITKEAGLPDGVFNVVQGTGREAGAPLTRHDGIRRLSFTGSVPTAGVIAEAAAKNIVPLSFELGGKSPLLVFDDADLDLAVNLAVEQFDNAGQVCLGAFRILVQDGIAEEFLERVRAKAATLVQGDPRDEATDVSALVSRPHFERVDGFVSRAKAAGARAILGGGPNEELGGLFYAPTILADAAEGSEILTEEVFGPVLTVQTFATEDQGVAMANNTRFGLAATLVTGDPERAERVSLALNAGTVWVNCFFVRDLGAPFGGNGKSGIGREGGIWSFDFYSDIKNTVFAPQRVDREDTSESEQRQWVRWSARP